MNEQAEAATTPPSLRTQSPRGSLWHRWDPHIHAPGTVLNDQYAGADPFNTFLQQLETADPPIRALGITDYCTLTSYEAVLVAKRSGRLSEIDLVFPNVELRYGIETTKGGPINVHILCSPDAPDHIERIKRFLDKLSFEYRGEKYCCNRDDLIRLGRAHDKNARDDLAALEVGTTQFKIDLAQLRREWRESEWVQANCLIAVAVGDKDGTSGLRDPSGSFSALRKELEGLAHIIFSGNPKQSEFWSGRGTATAAELEEWGGVKPCLHGSDAHDHAKVGAPDLERRCWLKGDVTFETLRQACLEPEGRVFVGPQPPRGAMPSQTISKLEVSGAPWLVGGDVVLNPGLVAIIGARGSGKTALADLVAAGAYALSPHLNLRSFIKRARKFLTDSTAQLTWESGEQTGNSLDATDAEDLLDTPRVQYLSQQFVDQLCSAEGVNDELLEEIERVIFQAHPIEERLGADTFRELLAKRTSRAFASRERYKSALDGAASEIHAERIRKASHPALLKQHADLAAAIDKDKKDRDSLIGKGQEKRVKRLNEVTAAADVVRLAVDQTKRRLEALLALQDEVKDIRETRAPAWLQRLRQGREDAGLADEQWKNFGVVFRGDVDAILVRAIADARKTITDLSGPADEEVRPDPKGAVSDKSLIASDLLLEKQTLSLLEKEQSRLRRLVGMDEANAKKLTALSNKITQQEAALAKVARDIERAAKADTRLKELGDQLRTSYEGIITSRIDEEHELQRLYAPLAEHLARQTDSLKSLTFSVRRSVDVSAWAAAGEELLDLRVQGPFKGKGSLLETARSKLLPSWTSGSAREVSQAMADFREQFGPGLIEHSPVPKSDKDAFRAWAKSISDWLYSTNHISISYSVQYDGMEIEQLSPGTRGIVLLLLYLAIDNEDDRPLLIDQPEENLDPQSIFQELVHRFRVAKTRRQIIVVTHNANLVVNTDADQVVVAHCGPHRDGQLPEMAYKSGGLENPAIRKHVCDILEGGEAAFRERAKRLRFRLHK